MDRLSAAPHLLTIFLTAAAFISGNSATVLATSVPAAHFTTAFMAAILAAHPSATPLTAVAYTAIIASAAPSGAAVQWQSTSQQPLAMPQGVDFPLDFDHPTYDWNYQESTGDSLLAGEPLLLEEEEEYSKGNTTIFPLPSSYLGNWDCMQLPTPQPSVSYPPQRPDQPLEGYTPPSSFTAHNPKFQVEQHMPVMHSMSPHVNLHQTPSAGSAMGPTIDVAELECWLYTPTHMMSASSVDVLGAHCSRQGLVQMPSPYNLQVIMTSQRSSLAGSDSRSTNTHVTTPCKLSK
ncbi:hypothetical protein PILCRDRAFT_12169 [Piloderma croceum F 1598]|uniref:Uncharacterized protein n=1 Tax=Piloderma croceum (strain F 1598) TaxID=765440 RepID=A0A0C3FBS6_PILCF|nr:hypothetical protein PILCRDRAFT_12169 [Piloderma croceum F 1598]